MTPGPDPDLAALLAEAAGLPFAERMGLLSARLLGRPYVTAPLVGSSALPERMVCRLDGFDCVTFAESVLALASCRRPGEFPRRLAALRYLDGEVAWRARNHYMSWWLERNAAAGLLSPLLPGALVREARPRALSALPGWPIEERVVSYLPSERAALLDGTARTGDVVCFVSTRSDLDTFHVGLLVQGDVVGLRHAARSRGSVVQEPLAAFLSREETPGMMLARPLEPVT